MTVPDDVREALLSAVRTELGACDWHDVQVVDTVLDHLERVGKVLAVADALHVGVGTLALKPVDPDVSKSVPVYRIRKKAE